jgi:signal transduction histidine kinase
MMRRFATMGCGLLCLFLLLWGAWLTQKANQTDREREELILDLQSQRVARHINAFKPEYEAYFLRFLNSERGQIRALLYDLSGWEIGRAQYTAPPVPLNEKAVRYASPTLLRPLHGEIPLTPYSKKPPELLAEKRLGNRLFATNVVGASWICEMKTSAGEPWLVATTSVNNYDEATHRSFVSAWIQTVAPLSEIERPGRERWMRFLFASATTLALFGGVAWVALGQSRSLRAAAAAADRIPLERLSVTHLPEPTEDPDAERLVRACNRLLDKVAEAHVAQQRFVADAAHELRTPLTILRGEIQVALREPGNHPFLVETLRSNLDEAVHLSRLVDGLLTLARADAGQTLVSLEPVDLPPLVRVTLAKLESMAAERRVRVEFECMEAGATFRTQADPVALERVIRNLVENAVKHSPADHIVRVTLSANESRIHVTVIDRGIGIPPEHLPKLFDRFYRVDAARRRTDGGTGLGLAIVRTLVEAQGGSVSVQSEIGVGSAFTIDIPRIP